MIFYSAGAWLCWCFSLYGSSAIESGLLMRFQLPMRTLPAVWFPCPTGHRVQEGNVPEPIACLAAKVIRD